MLQEKQEPEPQEEPEPRLYYFVGLIFLWLIPCFIVWISLSSLFAAPAVWLADLILTSALPEFVHEFTLSGSQAMLATNFGELDGKIVSAEIAGYRLAYPLNTRILSYSIPFYAALHFATQSSVGPAEKSGSRLAMGLLLLYPLMVVGLVAVCVKNLMLGLWLGPAFVDSSSTAASIIGLMYQLSTLMVPPLAPVLVWVWQSRENPALRQLLENATGIKREK